MNTKVRKKYTRKPYSKLAKVNVPEMLYQAFFKQVPYGMSTVIDKMRLAKPQPRGRGFTRLVWDLSVLEWEDLYARVCVVRGQLKGCDRDTQLRAAVCAKAMSFRMEALGVTSVIKYETVHSINGAKKRKGKGKKKDSVVTPVSPPAVDDVQVAISNPIVLDTADDVEEADSSNLGRFMADIKLGGIS